MNTMKVMENFLRVYKDYGLRQVSKRVTEIAKQLVLLINSN